jgi:putative ABC transport system permease protein
MKILMLFVSLFVIIYQSIVLALGQIWSNKMRSLLTMVGIIIGVASVTAVIAALSGLKSKVLGEFEKFGTNKIYILVDRPETGPHRGASWSSLQFKPELFDDLLEHCPSVSELTRLTRLTEKVRHAERTVEGVRISGVESSWHKIENRPVILGRPFSILDNREARFVCLINPVARDKLLLDRDCIGQSIMIGSYRYVIVGVLEPQPESGLFGEREAGLEVIIPFNTARRINRFWLIALASAKSTDMSEEARAEIQFYLRNRRHIKPGDPNTFRIEAVQNFVDKFKQLALAITLVAAGIVGISLVVGGVGIMNIMLVSVSERTREIGLRKAVGARPSAVLLQFLVEAITLCFVGGLLGLAAGFGIAKLLSGIPGARLDQAYVPGWAIALSFGFSALVGLVFGMFPALKAARLDPIEALRHE